MKRRGFRRAAVFAGTAALAAGGVAACGSDASTTAATGTATPQQSQQGRAGGPDMSALATKLGVSEAKLTAAMQKLRPAAGQQDEPGDMAASLAKALGLTEAKVSAALKAAMPQGGPGNGQPPGAGTAAPSGTPSSS